MRRPKSLRWVFARSDSQDVAIPSLGLSVHFDDGEELRTEISAKFHLAGVTQELALVGFEVVAQWQDAAGDFAVTLARKIDEVESVSDVVTKSEQSVEPSQGSPTRFGGELPRGSRRHRSVGATACPQRTRPFSRCPT